LNDLGDWIGDSDNKLSVGGDVIGGRPTLLWALALQGLAESDQSELLGLADPNCKLGEQARLAAIRSLYEKADVFTTALKLVDKHQARAESVADELESDSLRRLFYFLVDSVLERPEMPEPAVVSLGVNAAIEASDGELATVEAFSGESREM
jgi:geranylgeranyl pyrophosphate synthase